MLVLIFTKKLNSLIGLHRIKIKNKLLFEVYCNQILNLFKYHIDNDNFFLDITFNIFLDSNLCV